jgi:hypothetical protein
MEEQVNLYDFYWDCGRNGDLEGRFLATQEEVDALIGKEIYFGEVLGKHSEIYGEIEKGDITLVTDNQEFLKEAERLDICLSSGYSPLDYLTCPNCGEEISSLDTNCEDCGEIFEDDKD